MVKYKKIKRKVKKKVKVPKKKKIPKKTKKKSSKEHDEIASLLKEIEEELAPLPMALTMLDSILRDEEDTDVQDFRLP